MSRRALVGAGAAVAAGATVLALVLLGGPAGPGPDHGLIFQGAGGPGYRIFTMSAQGTSRRVLPLDLAGSLGFPRYSPDGRYVTFIGEGLGGAEDLYVAPASGGPARSIAPSFAQPENAPAWSPDGSRIAFSSRRDADWEIYLVKPDGSDLRQLTNQPGFDSGPTWSPDGKSIAFQSDRRGGGDSHIFVMSADGSDVRQITFADDEGAPDWSPDGSTIAFAGFTEGNADIWLVAPDGTRLRRLTADARFEYSPRWSPDGRWLAFEGYVENTPDIFVMAADGSSVRRITAGGGFAGTPSWRPGPVSARK